MDDAAPLWSELERTLREPHTGGRFEIDLSGLRSADGTTIALIVALRAALVGRGVACEIVGTAGRTAELVHLFRGDRPVIPVAKTASPRAIARFGDAVARLFHYARIQIEFVGDVASSTLHMIRNPALGNWSAMPALIVRAGTDGIPIVLLLNFLIGFVMAYQSSEQLQLYGANIYVADIVGISVTRELGPLMTAVIMCGRSGAAFAAELGTMRVSEEIDALRTLGVPPVPYLVVPRIIALAVAAPILTLLGDLVGVVGGLVVGAMSLDVTPIGYINELHTIVVASDVWTGLVKSVIFGAAIAFIGCQQGLATHGAASGVGRGTTTTVVNCLFTIVIADTLATVMFRMADL
jgi:phospholipid/cholesterol/gamma-HCH transport system permease protein